MIHRRQFVRSATGSVGASWLSAGATRLNANPLGLPIGLQLWTVRDDLRKDFDGTLHKVAEIGYKEVELFELPVSHDKYQKRRFTDAGLTCVGGHFYLNQLKDKKTIDRAKEIGLHYMIVVFPTLRSLANRDISNATVKELSPLYQKITLDDYKWNAEQFNNLGEVLHRQGMQLAYHNHGVDFKKLDNTVALNQLMQSTDPSLVKFELDCGHAIHAGHDPIAYLKQHASRIELLHLKDLQPGFAISDTLDTEEKGTNVEIGAGDINWNALFQVAKQARIKHYFVEHEGTMAHPPLESIQISYNYLHAMPA